MLFNSHVFIFAFAPIALLLFYGLVRSPRPRLALFSLFASSLFFYGWWNPKYLVVIGASIAWNYAIGRSVGSAVASDAQRKIVLALGVAGNLAGLGYFKYANFFVDNWNRATGEAAFLETIVLPLAISFFTFQQIAYLVDTHRERAPERNLLNYCVFVTFFPQLIAGPIVHHREMLPQFRRAETLRFKRENIEVGATIFFLGLFKKVVLADGVAVYSTPVFDAAAAGDPLSAALAWSGALAYTLQLYFDFSGYSDMAIGLGRLFGIQLPINFSSPYKANSIVDFWRRWHMTLSRFLREYLYIALGGNRHGNARRYANLLITMVLGGFWHGAGWTFVVWGGLHGSYLLVNHAWRAFAGSRALPLQGSGLGAGLARTITFLCVVVAWVFFRADSFAAASAMLGAMAGVATPSAGAAGVAAVAGLAAVPAVPAVPDGALLTIALLLAIAHFAPNTQDVMRNYQPGLVDSRQRSAALYAGRWLWRPTRTWAVTLAVVTVWSVLGINKLSEFLYFQF